MYLGLASKLALSVYTDPSSIGIKSPLCVLLDGMLASQNQKSSDITQQHTCQQVGSCGLGRRLLTRVMALRKKLFKCLVILVLMELNLGAF